MHWLFQPYNSCSAPFFFGGPLGMLFSFLFWAAILYVAVKFVYFIWQRQSVGESAELSVVQRRYAAGEIDEETYLKMKRNLGA